MSEAKTEKTEKTEKAIVAEKQQTLVKIKAVRPILVNRYLDQHGTIRGTIVNPGSVVDVPLEEANDLCDRQFTGHYSFGGQRSYGYDEENRRVVDPEGFKDATKTHDYRRAVRVA